MILRIHTSKSGKEAAHYFVGSKSQEAYYSTDGQEFAGNWGGKGAELLGLKGLVKDESLARLFANRHPLTGEQLTPRMRADRRPGFDVTFNVPKSVSLAYAWTKDERIIRAFRQAVLDTMTEMQEEAATRVRANGVNDGDRKTGALVWAEIIHLTARPQGGIPDPHLHSHCYVFNATWDEVEQKWKALQMGRIHEEADYYNWKVTHRLAENLKAIGLETVPTKDAFEIAGFCREFIEKFSRRTKTIEAEARKRGITDPAEKAKLAALTRERKSKSLLISEIEPYWWRNLTAEERRHLESVAATLNRTRAAELSEAILGEELAKKEATKASSEVLGTREQIKSVRQRERMSMNRATSPSPSVARAVVVTEHDRRAVVLGLEHVFERRSVVSEKRLIGEALKSFCVGRATHEGISRVVSELPLIRREMDGRLMVTMEEIVAEEKRILDACRSGKGKFKAMNRYWEIGDTALTPEQQDAVSHVLSSRDFITGVAGNPGVGKTRILREVRRGIEAAGGRLVTLAPWGITVHDVLRKEGFENAETVAKLLSSGAMQCEAFGAVWLVDEAGLLSTKEADQLIRLAKELNARLVLVGDAGQHHAVERGQAFDHLRKQGGMDAAEVLEIQRQKGAYKFFVQSVLKGDMERAFRLAARMDALVEMPREERKVALANDYVQAIEKGESALVVAPTHAECNEVTEGIRTTLKEKGLLKKRGVKWDVLPNLSWTDAQKRDCDQYENGMVVQINGHVKGFALGERLEVVGMENASVKVRGLGRKRDRIRALPLGEPDAFSVHERDRIELCVGDLIHITANRRTEDRRRLNNGSLHSIKEITPDGRLILENDMRLNRDCQNLEYGFALTSHAAQGKTVDRVSLAASPELSAGAIDLTQLLVSVTRGRKGMKIYTTDIELLREQASERRQRPMATELVQGDPDVETQEEAQARPAAKSRKRATKRQHGKECGRSGEWLGTQMELQPEQAIRAASAMKIKKEREREEAMGMLMGM